MFFLRFAPDGPMGAKSRQENWLVEKDEDFRRWSWPVRRLSCWCGSTKAKWSTVQSPEQGRAALTRKTIRRFADEMMHDEKERAEHVMLVDLGRNDVGRVSEFGSVKVDRLMFRRTLLACDAHRQLHRGQVKSPRAHCC